MPGDLHQTNASRRNHSTESPAFEVYQSKYRSLFGTSPRIELALEESEAIFHEAAVFVPAESANDSDTLFVTSNRLDDGIRISKLTRHENSWRREVLPDDLVAMANGAINYPSANAVLFCAQGTKEHPGGLQSVSLATPHISSPVLTSYHGRWFNSPNDVIIARDGAIWFTDPIYGFEQGFRPQPQLPSQLYRYEPSSGDLRVIADGFARPNGLAFDPDERTLYVTDTDWIHGDGTTSDSRVSHIYAFDIQTYHGAPFAINRRVFAMADAGAPDGIKCDLQGNVYSGCGDGVNIWAPDGKLVAKIVVPGGVANFCFGRPGELLLLNEQRFWVATIDTEVRGALLQGLNINS